MSSFDAVGSVVLVVSIVSAVASCVSVGMMPSVEQVEKPSVHCYS